MTETLPSTSNPLSHVIIGLFTGDPLEAPGRNSYQHIPTPFEFTCQASTSRAPRPIQRQSPARRRAPQPRPTASSSGNPVRANEQGNRDHSELISVVQRVLPRPWNSGLEGVEFWSYNHPPGSSSPFCTFLLLIGPSLPGVAWQRISVRFGKSIDIDQSQSIPIVGLQVPPQKVFGPSKPFQNTF